MFALVKDNKVLQVGNLPALWFDGDRWWDFRSVDPATVGNAGWFPVQMPNRPADTATTTWDFSVTLVGSTPTGKWTERPKTEEEVARANENAAAAQITADLRAAVEQIIDIRDMAQADIATATGKRDAAQTIADQIQAQRTQVAAWTPATTTPASAVTDFTLIRNQMVTILDNQKKVADAMADVYNYRRLNDNAVVTIYNAVLWLARKVSGRVI